MSPTPARNRTKQYWRRLVRSSRTRCRARWESSSSTVLPMCCSSITSKRKSEQSEGGSDARATSLLGVLLLGGTSDACTTARIIVCVPCGAAVRDIYYQQVSSTRAHIGTVFVNMAWRRLPNTQQVRFLCVVGEHAITTRRRLSGRVRHALRRSSC